MIENTTECGVVVFFEGDVIDVTFARRTGFEVDGGDFIPIFDEFEDVLIDGVEFGKWIEEGKNAELIKELKCEVLAKINEFMRSTPPIFEGNVWEGDPNE